MSAIETLKSRLWARDWKITLGLAALVLLAAAVLLFWDDGGRSFAGPALLWAYVALLLVGMPVLARRRGRSPLQWLLVGALLTPVIGALLLFALPREIPPEAP